MKKTFRKSAKALAVLASAFVLFNFMSCASDDDDDPPPAVTVSIDSEGYTAGSFYVGNEATLKAAVENSTKNVQWSVDPENIITLSSPIGQTVTITAVGKGTAVVTAKCESATKTFEVSVGTNPVTAELTELPWSVSMGTGFGSNDVFTKNVDDAGHGTWCTDNSEVPYDGIYYYGAANGYQFYAEDSGVWFNWYSSANTAVGNSTEGTRFDSYMAIAAKSLQSEKNVKITVNAKAVLKPETEGGEVKQPRLAVYTGEKYVLSDTELTEEAKDYTFVVIPKQKILIGNNGPNGSYMVVYSVKAEEVDDSAISQTPAINSITVTAPEQVQQGKTTQATAAVSVQFNADKTVTWASDNESVATVSETGVITGVSAGTAKITATSTVDSTKSGSATIEVITGEVKPEAGKTYTWDIKEYAAESGKNQGDPIADGSSNDTFLSWTGVKYHSEGYGVTCNGTISVKVAGKSVISFISSSYGSGTVSVADADGNEVLSAQSTKMAQDKTPFAFLYTTDKETTITLTFSATGANYVGTFEVKPLTNEQPSVTDITLENTEVFVGKTVAMKATVTAEYFADPSVTWSSDNMDVATVDESGIVTGVKAGTTKIIATSKTTPSVKGECEISVVEGTITTNTFDFSNGITDIKAAEDASIGITLSGAGYHGTDYGVTGKTTATFNVTGPATITLYPTYKWSSGTMKLYASGNTETELASATVSTNGNDAKISMVGKSDTQDPNLYTKSVQYTGEAGSLDLVIDNGGNTYFWKIVVQY